MHFRCRFAIMIKHRATQAVCAGQQMNMGAFPSGQWGQTVNLLLNASVVRIHQLPPTERYFERGIALFVFLNFAGIALVDSNSPGPAVTSRGAKMPQWGIFRARLANPPAPTKKDPQLRLRVFFCAVRRENSFQTKNVQAQRLAQLLS